MLIETDLTTKPAPAPVRRRRVRGDRTRPGTRPQHGSRARTEVQGRAHSCTGEPAALVLDQVASSWRLTDRGLAVVLVLVAMITIAAVTVVGLTALRVTSPGYQAYGSSALTR